MPEVRETIKVNRENDDSYTIVHTVVEKVDAKGLVKIHGDVENGLKALKVQLGDLPKQMAEREKFVRSQLDVITARFNEFGKHIKTAERKVKRDAEKEAEKCLKPDTGNVPAGQSLKPQTDVA